MVYMVGRYSRIESQLDVYPRLDGGVSERGADDDGKKEFPCRRLGLLLFRRFVIETTSAHLDWVSRCES